MSSKNNPNNPTYGEGIEALIVVVLVALAYYFIILY